MNPSTVFAIARPIREKSSGVLTFVAEKVVRQFMFHGGNPISAASNAKSELPGTYLLKEGKLTKEQYETYLQQIRVPKPNFWNLPGNDGSPIKAKYFVQLAKSVLPLPSPSSQFVPSEQFAKDPKCMEGIRFCIELFSDFDLKFIPKICPDFDLSSSIFFDEKIEKGLSPLPLSPEEKGMLTVVAHNHVLSEVFASSFLGKEKISRLLLSFWALGLVRMENASTVARKNHDQKLNPIQKTQIQDLKNHLISLSTSNYYEWLKVSKGASPEEISQNFQAWAEKLLNPSLPRLFFGEEAQIPEKLLDSLKEAATTLLNADRKREYDQYLSTGKTGSIRGMSSVGKELDTLQAFDLEWKEGDKAKALLKIEQSITEHPTSSRLLLTYSKAVLELTQGKDPAKKNGVLAKLEPAAQKSDAPVELIEVHAQWMEVAGNSSKAVEGFKRALSSGPFSIVTYQALERLAPNEVSALSLKAVHQNISKWNYYQMLGLKQNANVKGIQQAYRDCTKRFHPDRFFKEDEVELKAVANEVYKQMVKAYMTLKSSPKRAEYDRTLGNPSSK